MKEGAAVCYRLIRKGERSMWYEGFFSDSVIKGVQSIANPFFDTLFVGITLMGEETFFMLIAVFIFWCCDKRLGYKMGFTFFTGVFVNGLIKSALKVPRPIGDPGIRSIRIETAEGYSFPSGHTQNAAMIWSSLFFHVKKRWVTLLGIVLIFLTALSRLYLGVHRPLDVLVGIALGIFWTLVCNFIFHYAEKTGKSAFLLVLILPCVFLAIQSNTATSYKVLGVLLAFFLGYIVESRYIRFDVHATFPIQIIKLAVGIGVLFALKTFVKALLPESAISDLFRYFLMGLWITVIGPYLFVRFIKTAPSAASST
mgnify:CR=1 FL=1